MLNFSKYFRVSSKFSRIQRTKIAGKRPKLMVELIALIGDGLLLPEPYVLSIAI